MLETSSSNSLSFFRNLGRVRQALEGIKLQIESKPLKQQDIAHKIIAAPIETVIVPTAAPIVQIEPIVVIQTSDASIQTEEEKIEEPQQTQPQPVQPQPLSVLERLEMRFLKQTVNQYNEDTQIIYGNFTDSLRVIEALKQKVAKQKEIISSTYESLQVDYKKLQHSNKILQDQSNNFEKLSEFWKKRFQILKEAVQTSVKENNEFQSENPQYIAQLKAENLALRQILNIAYSEASLKKLELNVEETESDFYNNHCSKNPPPSDFEIKYMTSQNKGLNKEFKKFVSVEKSFQPDDFKKPSFANVIQKEAPDSNHWRGQNEVQTRDNLEESQQRPNVIVHVTTAAAAQKAPAMTAKDFKSFNESSSKFESLMKRIEGDQSSSQSEKVKQSQMRLLDGGNSPKSLTQPQNSTLLDSDEVQIQVEDEDDDEDEDDVIISGSNSNHQVDGSISQINAKSFGAAPPDHSSYEEHDEQSAGVQVTQSQLSTNDTNSKASQLLPKESTTLIENNRQVNSSTIDRNNENSSNGVGGQNAYGGGGEEEEEEQDEEEQEEDEEIEEGEYYDETIHFNEYYGSAKTQQTSEQQKQQQQQQQQPQQVKQAFDFSDRARAKELLLMQSKQLQQQMTNPKFFKSGVPN